MAGIFGKTPVPGSGEMGKRTLLEHLFTIAALVSAVLTGAVFVFLAIFAIPLIKNGQFFQLLFSNWLPQQHLYGIYPMLAASTILASLSLALSFPVSLFTSFFITAVAPRQLRMVLLYIVRFMTGIPTVVYSFAALFLLVPLMRAILGRGSGMSILTAVPVLSLLIAPTMIIFFVNSFQRIPSSTILAADSLGATPVQKVLYVIVPQAWPGILNGLLLGLGRAIGDTMVSLMLAGNSPTVPQSLADSARTLTAHIGLVLAFDFDSMEFKSVFVSGLVLYVSTAIIMSIFRITSTISTGRRK